MQHYTDYASFSSALIGFHQLARREGFAVGLQNSQDSVQAALLGLWLDKPMFEYALTALFCRNQEEKAPFSLLFKRFWLEKGSRIQSKSSYKNQKQIIKQSKSVAVMMGLGKSNEGGQLEESKNTAGANAKEVLKSTDFSKLSAQQSEELDELANQLIREMSLRIKRKRKKAKSGQIDLGKSLRKNITKGSNMLQLVKTTQKKEKFSLVVLLDVSGSMDKYSYYLLKFLWSLRSHFKQIEVFTFSTILIRITDQLADIDIAQALASVSRVATHWSSGTKIGACLQDFNDNYARYYLNGRTLSLVLSDGLDTGEPEDLSAQLEKIKWKSKRLIWLNPLKGMTGYQPIQSGMQAAMPTLDHFGAAHNFASLLALENILTDA